MFHPLPPINTCVVRAGAERRRPRGGGPARAGLGWSAAVRRSLPRQCAHGAAVAGWGGHGAAGGEGSVATSLGGATE